MQVRAEIRQPVSAQVCSTCAAVSQSCSALPFIWFTFTVERAWPEIDIL